MAWSDSLAAADRVIRQTLGGSVSFRPAGESDTVVVSGLFEDEYQDSRGDQGVVNTGPAVFVSAADLKYSDGSQMTVYQGATVTVNGVEYTVREPRLDGQGGLLLHLQVA